MTNIRWRRLATGAAVIVLAAVGAAFTAVEVRWTRTFDAPYPNITASMSADSIARGRYLAYGPAACAYCHVPRSDWSKLDDGASLPLAGAHRFPLPLGSIYSANLTPDRTNGIGRRSDAELARILRFGVRADGRAAVPLMEFHDIADDDLEALLSFLRAQPPVSRAVPEHQLTTLGKAVMAFAIEPKRPEATPPRTAPPAVASVARGEYLANNVSHCVGCHTERDLRSGAYTGPKFAGGLHMDIADDPTKVFVPPNLTPDPTTSPIAQWSEETFLVRFRQGTLIKDSPMPWGAYARMTEDDMRSLYRYLRSLPAIEHQTGPVMQGR